MLRKMEDYRMLFAKLRKVLCLDARSMADASAKEIKDTDHDLSITK